MDDKNINGVRSEEAINEGTDDRRNSSWGTHASPVNSHPNRDPFDCPHD